jgi:hypothetical protein
MDRRWTGALVAGIACALVTLPQAASGTGDTVRPTVFVPATPLFVVGSRIGPMLPLPPDATFPGYDATRGIKQRLRWAGFDSGSGICRYATYAWTGSSQPVRLGVFGPATRTLTVSAGDYDGWAGGGAISDFLEWTVLARDCAGNVGWSSAYYATHIALVQEDGGYPPYDRGFDGNPAITYAGTWTRVTGVDYSGGAAERTRHAGSSVTYTADFHGGEPVALVMQKGRGHGTAVVSVDGVPVDYVRTWRASLRQRVVAWQTRMPAGRHSVTVTATTDRAVVLDAVLQQRVAGPITSSGLNVCPDPSDPGSCFAS